MTCGRLSRVYLYHSAAVLMVRKFPAPEWGRAAGYIWLCCRFQALWVIFQKPNKNHWTRKPEFMPREGQSSDSLSSRGVLGDSSPAWPLPAKAEARSETQPDHGGAHHRADLPSWTQWLQKKPVRQRCPRQQARPPCARTSSEC